jgi:hypothetical protein
VQPRQPHRCILYSALQRSPVQHVTLAARTATEARPDHSSPSPRGKTAAARRSCGRGVPECLGAYPSQVLVTPLFEAFTDIIPALKEEVMAQIERRARLMPRATFPPALPAEPPLC